MAWWESASELLAASVVSDQSHQHLVWTGGKDWFFCLLGMSEGPDNYIWQSQDEWLCNVIAKNYPFNSISGCLGFSDEMTSLFCGGFPFCRAASQLVLFVLALTLRCLFFLLFSSFPALFLQPLCLSLQHVPTLPCFRDVVVWKCLWGKYLLKDSRQHLVAAKWSIALHWPSYQWLASGLHPLLLYRWYSEVMGEVAKDPWLQHVLFLIVPCHALQHSLLISASVFPSVKVV